MIHSSRSGLFRGLAVILLAGLVICCPPSASAQTAAQAPRSLADSLRSAAGKEHHIFYVHGIASDGPDDYDSWNLRRAICDFVKDCTTPAGELAAKQREYADQDEFSLTAEPPALEYLGEKIWKTSREWSAASPYVVHWKLARSAGPAIYVDEINWWPLVFSLKCRQIVRSDAELVGPNVDRIKVCSTLRKDPIVPGRFRSFDWIAAEDAPALLSHVSRGALVNRKLKNGILDWGFSDAILALGPLRPYLLDGIRQLILKSVAVDGVTPDSVAPSDDQEYVIVSHSLGSYLIFAALDITKATPKTRTVQEAGDAFDQILARTSLVYFFANQLRLLELANLDGTSGDNIVSHLEAWGRLRCDYLKSQPGALGACAPPQIVALNDPSDLLTWTVPELKSVKVNNVVVKNSTRWFGLVESPTKAHDNYAKNKSAIRHMLKLGPREDDRDSDGSKVATGYR